NVNPRDDSAMTMERKSSKSAQSRNRNTVAGTPYYMSPEVVRKDQYNETVDWWAFGVLVFECTLGKYPFQGKTALELFREIRRCQPDLSELRGDGCVVQATDD